MKHPIRQLNSPTCRHPNDNADAFIDAARAAGPN